MKIPKISQQNKILLCSFFFLMVVYLFFGMKNAPDNTSKMEKIYADTMIPRGFVLIPIELANVDTVSALMGQFGIVDLFTGSVNEKGHRKLASKIKLLRAPLNPNQYAVLVPENLSTLIMSSSGPFWAVVQNRNSEQASYKEKVNHTIRIEYHQSAGVNQ